MNDGFIEMSSDTALIVTETKWAKRRLFDSEYLRAQSFVGAVFGIVMRGQCIKRQHVPLRSEFVSSQQLEESRSSCLPVAAIGGPTGMPLLTLLLFACRIPKAEGPTWQLLPSF